MLLDLRSMKESSRPLDETPLKHGVRTLAAMPIVATLVACGTTDTTSGAGGYGAGGSTSVAPQVTATTTTTGSTATSTAATGVGGAGGAPQDPDFDSIPWATGTDIGFGVAFKDTQNHLGNNVFIGDAGYGLTLDASEKWVSALYAASLKARGVRYVYAVQGPADVTYAGFEIGNSKIAAALQTQVTASTHFIVVASHSSGAYVGHELLNQLATGSDPSGVTNDKVVYFDLDGGVMGLNQTSVNRLHRAYFFSAFDSTTNTYSPNHSSMLSGGAMYGSKGGYHDLDADASGCDAGATWCLHMTMITTLPHDPTNSDAIPDYSDFVGRPVSHSYIDAESSDAGLDP